MEIFNDEMYESNDELNQSFYDKDTFIVFNQKNIIVKNILEDSTEKYKIQIKPDIKNEFMYIYEQLQKYTYDNALNLLEKCTAYNLYFFLKKYYRYE